MSLENARKSAKFKNRKPFLFCFLFCFLHWYVKGFSSKRITLKVDVTGPENILFAGASVHLSARKFDRRQQ